MATPTHDRPGAAQTLTAAPVPPQNLDAEESVLGACMLTPRAIDAASELLEPRDFYRESHGRIFDTIQRLRGRGEPVDAITLVDELDRLGVLEEIGGQHRITELAALVPAASNVAHYARIVREMSTLRALIRVGNDIARLGFDRPDETEALVQRARELTEDIEATRGAVGAINLQTHQEVLATEIVQEQYLVDDLIPAGAVGTIAAVPEAHKSWLAQAIAIRVAAGHGWILGKQVVHQTPVAYLWQDDSTAAELTRVKLFEERHPNHGELPILWGLNVGVQLPRDLHRLRTTIQQNHLGLVVLDSLYNFVTDDLKDDGPERIVAELKREICDTTGCTILIVDHMPWATDTNRGRLRAYGGVFKNAATRFGIYIDAVADKLHIEARGNNISGIPKTLAYWDADQLELKLIHNETVERDVLVETREQEVLDWLADHPGSHSNKAVRDGVGGKATLTDAALANLQERGLVADRGTPSRRAWTTDPDALAEAAARASQESLLVGTTWDDHPADRSNRATEPSPDHSGLAGTSSTSSPHAGTSSGPTGLPTPEHAAGNQADLVPAKAPLPYRGGADRDEEQAPDPDSASRTSSRTARQHWIDAEGWLVTNHDQLTAQILERWPDTNTNEIADLLKLAGARAAEELGTS